MEAAQRNDKNALLLLLGYRAFVNTRAYVLRSVDPICSAVAIGRSHVVKLLQMPWGKCKGLMARCMAMHFRPGILRRQTVCARLAECGRGCQRSGRLSLQSLIGSCRYGRLEVIQISMDAGVDANAYAEYMSTPLRRLGEAKRP